MGFQWIGGEVMSRSGDVQYIGGYHDSCGHQEDIISTLRDIMIHVGELIDKSHLIYIDVLIIL